MTRIILYVRNVAVLKNFYQKHFEFSVVEEIAGEWVVLNGGAVELALHLMGKQYRSCMPTDGTTSNAKLVFTVRSGLLQLRDELLAAGVPMKKPKRYAGFPQFLCDGQGPEGNVFQLSQPD